MFLLEHIFLDNSYCYILMCGKYNGIFSFIKPGADPDRCNRSICYGQIFQR